jgi:pimeloyl-ACP methyl ester carboxylesterase
MQIERKSVAVGLSVVLLAAGLPGDVAAAAEPRHLIYLHGRIVQEQQTARPKSPEYGYYELEKILTAFRKRGFLVTGSIRPKDATVSASADAVVAEVRRLLASGVRPDHITVVGASMGAAIAFRASARLQNPELRFAVLGACLSGSIEAVSAEEGKTPSGYLLCVREASDETSRPCADLKNAPGSNLVAREIVIDTGLRHGFLYRPLPEWLDPVVQWANAARAQAAGKRS